MTSWLIQGLQTQLHPISSAIKDKYANDPAGFVVDLIRFPVGEHPTDYQLDCLNLLAKYKRLAVRGPHGLGKTALAAWFALWGIETADDVKVGTTAGSWHQLNNYLWPEIHKWATRLRWDKLGREPYVEDRELMQTKMNLGPTRKAFAAAPSKSGLIEGAHAERMIYILDESKSIPQATWDSIEGAFASADEHSKTEAFALAISTPGEPAGRFFDIHRRKPGYEDWHSRHVTLEETLAAGRVSRSWADQKLLQWGEKSPMYLNRVQGEFAASEEDSIIPLAWIEIANARWLEWVTAGKPGHFSQVGVDVARGGPDNTVLAPRFGDAIDDLRIYPKQDLMATVGNVVQLLRKYPEGRAMVDVIGMGGGVVDRLRELKYNVVAFNASAKSDMMDVSGELGFRNLRAASYWHLRELLDPQAGIDIAIPPDDDLTGELTSARWKQTSTGLIQMESKADIKKRIGRSPDKADAVVMAFWDGEPTPEFFYGAREAQEEEMDGYSN